MAETTGKGLYRIGQSGTADDHVQVTSRGRGDRDVGLGV